MGMVDIAPPDEAEVLGTAVTASPLATDAPVKILWVPETRSWLVRPHVGTR